MSRSIYYHTCAPERKMSDNREDCPLCSDRGCSREKCRLWNDDWNDCVFSAVSLSEIVRTAITDATVEIMRAYGDDRR